MNILNGVALTPRQEMTLNFAIFLVRQELKDKDALGPDSEDIRQGYLAGTVELAALLRG